MPIVVEAVERLQRAIRRPLLLLVGDGPERAPRAQLSDKPFVRFSGCSVATR